MGRHEYVVTLWPSLVLWLVVLAAVGALIYMVARLSRGGSGSGFGAIAGSAAARGEAVAPPAPSSARTIIEERFARGEIDADEFQEMLRLLNES